MEKKLEKAALNSKIDNYTKGVQMKKSLLTASMILAFSMGSIASDSSQAQKDPKAAPTKESREQMAAAHEKMAQCLRSDSSIEDCHEQMREQCHEMKDEGHCSMMGEMGKGMHKHHKKNDAKKDK